MPSDLFTDKKARIAKHVFEILRELEGTNFAREGLTDTPERVAQFWLDVTVGQRQKPEDIMKVFEDGADKVDQMVFQGNIPFYSQCEHHMVPFFGVAHLAYIPGKPTFSPAVHQPLCQTETDPTSVVCTCDPTSVPSRQKILGLSKFARLLEIFTRRLQVQERITTQVVDALVQHLNPTGAACVIRARHLCMECRGVEKIGTITMTSALRGAFMEDPTVRAEFMQFVAMSENRSPNI